MRAVALVKEAASLAFYGSLMLLNVYGVYKLISMDLVMKIRG